MRSRVPTRELRAGPLALPPHRRFSAVLASAPGLPPPLRYRRAAAPEPFTAAKRQRGTDVPERQVNKMDGEDAVLRDEPLSVADLRVHSVDEHHRIERMERPGPPLGHGVQSLVPDREDRLLRGSMPYDSERCGDDLVRRSALRGQREDQVVQPTRALRLLRRCDCGLARSASRPHKLAPVDRQGER
jgi:hypothetical protein